MKLACLSIILCLTIAAGPIPACHAAIWYVDFRQTQDTQTGQSWNNAYTNPQGVLLHPNLSAGDTVRVAKGSYTPAAVGQRAVSFVLVNGVALRGGYNGLSDPQNPDGRVIDPTLTVLSGDLNRDDVDSNPDLHQAERAENSLVVVHAGTQQNPVNASAILDNFTISDGHHFEPDGIAAGLYVPPGSNPTIENCIFKRNAVPPCCFGAGVFVITGDTSGEVITRFSNCAIEDNEGGQGAGLIAIRSFVRLEDCIIRGNRMTGQDLAPGFNQGAGFLLLDETDATFIRCQVLENTWSTDAQSEILAEGGGGAVMDESRLYMKHCLVAGNQLNTTGNFNAVCAGGGLAGINMTLVDTVIDANFIDGKPAYGAGLFAGPGGARPQPAHQLRVQR